MTIIEKILYYLFNEYYLKIFIQQNYIKLMYDKKYKGFVQKIIDFYKRYNAMPSENEFQQWVKEDINSEEYYLWFIKYSKMSVAENFGFLIDLLRKEYSAKGLQYITDNTNKSNVDLGELSLQINKLKDNISDDTDIRERFVYENLEDRIDRVKNSLNHKLIPSGFAQFDRYAGGGFDKKRIYLFFGRQGIGKSRTLFNFCYNLVNQGYKGIYFTFEMPIEEMEMIFDTRLGGISWNQLRTGQVDMDYYKEVVGIIGNRKFPLKFIEHTGTPSMDFIESKVKEFNQKDKLDFIVVDYLGLMFDSNDSGGEEYQVLGNITRRLKNLAKKEDMFVITAQQANRKSKEKSKDGKETEVGPENISGSDKIGANCDFIAYIHQGKLDRGILNIDIVKNRSGENNRQMKMLVDFPTNTMKDAIEFNNPIEN